MITSILMAIDMAICILAETLLPGGGGVSKGRPLPKDEKDAKNGSETNSKPWHCY